MSSTLTQEAPAATGSKSTQSPQSAFVQHLATYPAVTAVAGLVASVPVVKIFVSNAVPLLHAVHDRTRPVVDPLAKTAEPVLQRADALGDSVLTHIDSRFPALKSVQPADLIEGAQSRFNSVRSSAQQAVDARIVQPISGVATAAKEQYSKVYDSQGEALSSGFNTRISPLNDRIANIIDEYLPATESTPLPAKEGSQLSRSASLVKTAALRAQPIANKLQISTRDHVKSTYASILKDRAGDASPSLLVSIIAAAATGRVLAHESAAKVYSLLSTKVEPSAEKKAQQAQDKIQQAAKAVQDKGLTVG